MKDDQSDSQNKNNKRCKREEISASSSDNSDSGNPLTFSKGSRKQFDSSDEDETTNSEAEEVTVVPNRRKPIPVILSDYESGDSIADVNENNECLTESFESLSDDDDDGTSKENNTNKKTQDAAASESSSDWDCQSEKCPICLAKFSQQVIGNPESCDHCFCLDCIQEWAKNVNTCPVDRQSFTLILVRQHLEGKVIRQIPVSQPANEQTVSEDATFCEVCGLGDREDRMLLCDACDNGYHMECLNPPLLHVPIEEWHCPDCSPLHNLEMLALNQNRVEDNETLNTRFLPQNRPVPRMLPRTRQSERVQRNLRSRQLLDVPQSASYMQEFNAGGSTQINQRGRRATRRTRKYKRTTKNRIKRIVTEDGIIEVRLKGKKSRKYKKKRKSRTLKSAPRSVKGRLANRLGICAPRMTKQTIPETLNRQEAISAPINHQRHQAGIPTLDIFGRRDQLDYFSGSDQEDDVEFEGSFGVISRVRSSRPSDRFISRKKAATVLSSLSLKKPQKVENVSLPADGNLLDSILNSQTLWHSKKSEIKSSSDGSLHVVLQKFPNTNITKEDDKIDVRRASAPVIETPMFPGGRVNAGTFDQDRGSSNQNDARSSGERSYEASSHQPSGSAGSGYPSYSSSVSTSSPLRGMAPIRFRMNAPPRRPNIHSYPSDNIPPPPPLRLRSPLAEMTFTATNSPDETPPREEEEIDIYSDIEQDNNSNELEEKSFGTLEPPPEPPFLMTMEPPPEPPAILMNLNEDASDDEASGLVIDDPPPGDVYDPCANSDESSTEDAPLAKPPELPIGLKDSELVADYSSDSQSDILPPSYNPELPTFMNTPIIGPLLQPPSHNSSDENDEDCPNFSMYSVASMTLAQRGLPPLPVTNLDIPIPPPNEKETVQTDIDIPLPEDDSPIAKENEISCDIALSQSGTTLKGLKSYNEDSNSSIIEDKQNDSEDESILDEEPNKSDSQICNLNTVEDDGDDEQEDDDDDEEEEEEEIVLTENCKKGNADSQSPEKENSENSVNGNIEMDKTKSMKGLSEMAEDECSTQGDVLDLVIESENNLEHNVPHDDNEKLSEQEKSPIEMEENDENNIDGGDKSDGLVDITDEDMSVYDGQDNNEDLDRFDDPDGLMNKNKHNRKSLDSDDDNSLVGGATSAISAGTINNSDNVQPQTLPGLEGLETETISESEDVNFDELPLEDNEQIDALLTEEDHTISRKKKKKKNRKASHLEDVNLGVKEPLEFEEGEIVDDKPKQTNNKKDKKGKNKPENTEVGDKIDVNKAKVSNNEKDSSDKKLKKKKDKNANNTKDKSEKSKEPKEKTLKPGEVDENIAWKKLSKSTKERNYRDGKEKDERERDRENKTDNLSKKEKRNKEKRKELERYNVRRLISEKPKRPKKDEFGRDISPSKSGSSLSPYRPPKYRSPLRTRNRSRTRSRSYKSRSRSRGRRRRSRSRDRVRSRDRSRRVRSRDKSRRSRSQNNLSRSKEKRKTPENLDRSKNENRSNSRTRKKSRSRSVHSRRRSLSYSKSWTLSWSGSSKSRSPSRRRRSRSITRSKSRSWTRDKNVSSMRETRANDPPKNLTVIVTNKDALKKKDKKKISKKKDDRKKKKRNSPAPSKEVFTSGDNILVSVNFKNANKNLESVPAGTPLLRESSKRKRDDLDGSARKKKNTNSKKSPGAKKSSRLTKINEVTRNAKPVAIIDLDLSPFREQTPSPKEVIVLSDSGDEEDKQHSQLQDELERLGHNSMNQSVLSLPSMDHKQKNSVPQPESPISSSFILNSSGPKTPPEPHIKFSISTKPSQIRMLSNPLMEAEEEMPDESTDNDMNEKLHKGPNTPPEPPPDLNTPASPPTTPYDPFDPTKSRSPSPQPRGSEIVPQLNSIREDKTDNLQKDESDDHSHLAELHSLTPPIESEDIKQTPESAKVHSTPKSDPNNTDGSPKVSPSAGSSELAKVSEDTLMKPVQKLLVGANKLDVTVHKSPEKLITVVINQPVKNQTPKQAIPPLKNTTPIKHSTPKGNAKHQLFSSSLIKQVPMLSSLLPGPPVYTPMGLASGNKSSIRVQQNGDPSDDMDIDLGSPYSPGSSEGDDLFEPPLATPPRNSAKSVTRTKTSSSNKFDTIFGSSPAKLRHGRHSSKATKKGSKTKSKGNKKEEVKVKLDEDQLKILDELPSSAVEMQFLKKLNRQERVVEEVKLVLKPHYAKKHVNKEEYKEILRRSVPKICHNKSGEINPLKIQSLVEAYVKKFRYSKKKSTGPLPTSAQNKPKPQKTLWS